MADLPVSKPTKEYQVFLRQSKCLLCKADKTYLHGSFAYNILFNNVVSDQGYNK